MRAVTFFMASFAIIAATACGSDGKSSSGSGGAAGSIGTGGSNTGGSNTGGSNTGGGNGGTATGGIGGTATGGTSGATTGGTGGTATGGTGTGGTATGGTAGCPTATLPPLDTTPFATGFNRPVFMAQAPGDDARFYVVEQVGRVQLVRNGATAGVFMNLMTTIQCGTESSCLNGQGNERGLLGFALHPNYVQNGRFYIYYANLTAPYRNVLREYRRNASNPDVADNTVVATLFDQADPEWNHNGGMLAFGSDGFLYFAVGDGGGSCDNHGGNGNAQNTNSPFGKIHRFDVDAASTGYVAAGNPFATGGGLGTVWAYGLRNPWRFSFDRVTHDMWIGDVGQNAYEEIDFQPASSTGGENYGWRVLEGNCSSTASGCTSSATGCLTDPQITALGFVPPVFVAAQNSSAGDILSNPAAINSGYVYRGSAIPNLRGWYLFGDSSSESRGAIRRCNGAVTDIVPANDLELAAPFMSSFAEDNAGELYMVSQGSGSIIKIVAP
jgi:glucose/arabinose dehydrogenase